MFIVIQVTGAKYTVHKQEISYDPKINFINFKCVIGDRLKPECVFIHRDKPRGGEPLNDLASALYASRIYGDAYIYPTRPKQFDNLYKAVKDFHQREYVQKQLTTDITFIDD